MDWVSLAKGYGVPACQVTNLEQLNQALSSGLGKTGPYLIEAQLA